MQSAMIHPTAEVQTPYIGEGTSVWQFCIILQGARIGRNCNINCHVFIENDVVVGDNVTVKSGVQLWDGLRIEDNVFVGPNVTFTNDLRPRSGQRPDKFLKTTIKKGASIGANSTIIGSKTIGSYAMIGGGSVVTHDIPDHTLWHGNPARCRGYICYCGNKLNEYFKCTKCGVEISPAISTMFSSQADRFGLQPRKMNSIGSISKNCTIYDNVRLGKDVTICDNAIVYSNVEIGDGTFVGPDCILGEPITVFYKNKEGYENPTLSVGKNSIIRSHSILYAGSRIGESFQTGHHVTIRERTQIGRHCSVGTYGDIQGEVQIGDYCRFHSNVHISQFTVIKNYVFIFPNCVLTNDPHPPSNTCIKGPTVEDYCVISAGAILMPGIIVGKDSIVGANSLVSKDVNPESVVMGVPARQICTIYDIKCKEGLLEKPYPWRNHFSYGIPSQ
jgi:acetyltransferase-like isoleucine patch superfamily enzyme